MSTRYGDLNGRSAIVTGVGSGVGRAVAHELVGAGARVLGCDIDDVAGSETMRQAGGSFMHADVSREREVSELVLDAVRRFGRLDILVNNAAVQIEHDFIETTEDELDRILGTNVKGVFFGCKHGALAMRETGGGVIINLGSILSFLADGILAAYCAAECVLGITRATAVQYGIDGIRCNAVCPGDIETPLLESYLRACQDPVASRQQLIAKYPLGRFAQPSEVARTIVFLASDESSFVNGQELIVDGGLMAKY